jgi:hypothetical protein
MALTGEVRIDDETLTPGRPSARSPRGSARAGVPCAAVAGRNELSRAEQNAAGLAATVEATTLAAIEDAAFALLP